MNHTQTKLENPERIAELNPKKNLIEIGLKDGDTFCDIGAGSGIFTIEAAKITNNSVYAIDINEELLDVIKEKAKSENLNNIIAQKVVSEKYDIAEESIDIAALITVLHEIDDKSALLAEIRRILKKSGKLAVIEFHKKETKIGPPLELRLDKNNTASICQSANFSKIKEFDLGENLYCIVFEKL